MFLNSVRRRQKYACGDCGSVFYEHTRASRVFVVLFVLFLVVLAIVLGFRLLGLLLRVGQTFSA